MDHLPTPSQAPNSAQYRLLYDKPIEGLRVATVPQLEQSVQIKRQIVGAVVARGFLTVIKKIGVKRVSGALARGQRTIRHWANEEREPGAVDLMLAARACRHLKARLIALLHIPEAQLHRAEQELQSMEKQADALADDAYDALARQAGGRSNQRRTGLRAMASAVRGLSLRFRRRREGAGA